MTRHDRWVHAEDVQLTPSTSAGRNQIQQQFGRLLHDAPPSQWGLLKREALIATHTMLLHAYSVSNLGGDGKASVTVVDLMTAAYGTFDKWEHDFRLTGMSLAGGSDWIIVYDNPCAAGKRCVRPGDGNHCLRRARCRGGWGARSAW